MATPAAPTIVVVHGAFADASGFGGVTSRRQTAGRTVVAPPNPLPSLAFDTGAIAACVDAIAGPMVLVGHSSGGAVITESSATLDTVTALAYLAAFSPNKCERCARVQDPFPSPLASTSDPTSHDTPGAPQRPDLIITKEQFRETFCADVPIDVTEVMFATQRPLSLAALTGKATAVVRKSKPSWYLVHAHDNAIPPDAERFMVERMSAQRNPPPVRIRRSSPNQWRWPASSPGRSAPGPKHEPGRHLPPHRRPRRGT